MSDGWCVVLADTARDYTVIGTFIDEATAIEYAEANFKGTSWWITTMEAPEEQYDTALEEGCRYERAFGDASDVG